MGWRLRKLNSFAIDSTAVVAAIFLNFAHVHILSFHDVSPDERESGRHFPQIRHRHQVKQTSSRHLMSMSIVDSDSAHNRKSSNALIDTDINTTTLSINQQLPFSVYSTFRSIFNLCACVVLCPLKVPFYRKTNRRHLRNVQ